MSKGQKGILAVVLFVVGLSVGILMPWPWGLIPEFPMCFAAGWIGTEAFYQR